MAFTPYRYPGFGYSPAAGPKPVSTKAAQPRNPFTPGVGGPSFLDLFTGGGPRVAAPGYPGAAVGGGGGAFGPGSIYPLFFPPVGAPGAYTRAEEEPPPPVEEPPVEEPPVEEPPVEEPPVEEPPVEEPPVEEPPVEEPPVEEPPVEEPPVEEPPPPPVYDASFDPRSIDLFYYLMSLPGAGDFFKAMFGY